MVEAQEWDVKQGDIFEREGTRYEVTDISGDTFQLKVLNSAETDSVSMDDLRSHFMRVDAAS